MSLTVRFSMVGLLLGTALMSSRAPAANEGQAELDRATQAKLSASTITDLANVIGLLETALEKGLDEQNTLFATQLLAATRIQRGSYIAKTIFDSGRSGPDWIQFRRAALEDLEKGVELAPKQPEALLRITRLNLLPGGDAKRAARALDEAVRFSTEEPTLHAMALTLRAELDDDSKKKLADLDEAVRSDPNAVEPLRVRATVHLDREEPKLALADLEKALELEPDHAPTVQDRGVVLIELERFDEALESLERAHELAPESVVPLIQRGRALGLQSKFEEALEDLNRAYLMEPGNLGVLILRATVYQELDQPEEALADLDRVLSLKPDLTPAMRLRAILLVDSGDFDGAILQLEELRRADPEDTAVALQLAMLYNGAEKPRQAVETYSEILAVHPHHPLALLGRGDARLAIGEHAKAIADYERALDAAPEHPSLLNNFAWVLATSPDDPLRDGPRAIELATKACELTEYKAAHILSTLAAGYAETGDFKTAAKWSKKAVELGAGDQKEQLAKEVESYDRQQPWRERQTTPEGGEPDSTEPDPPQPESPEDPNQPAQPEEDLPGDK